MVLDLFEDPQVGPVVEKPRWVGIFFDRNFSVTIARSRTSRSETHPFSAEVDGLQIVFPLGPDLNLSWASCNVQVDSNRTKLYSCELKPGYRFR
jgi:hypothetical protein